MPHICMIGLYATIYTISVPVHNCVVFDNGQLIGHWNHGDYVAMHMSQHIC
jgi:hypothetical protein